MAKVKRDAEAWAWLGRAVSTENRYYAGVLGCVSVEAGGVAVATDRHRLHVVRGEDVGRTEGLHPVSREASAEGRYPNWGQVMFDPAVDGVPGVGLQETDELLAVCEGLATIRRRLGEDAGYWAALPIGGVTSLVNPAYLLDALRGMRTGEVRITRAPGRDHRVELRPLLVSEPGAGVSGRSALLMPVNVPRVEATMRTTYSLERFLLNG